MIRRKRKEVLLKNCVLFTDHISEKNNIQLDNAKHIDVMMQMYNLIECSSNYSKKNQDVYGNIIQMNQMII